MRLLRRLRPRIDVARRVVAPFVFERSGLGPGALDEVDRLPELAARGRRRHVVVEGLRPRSRREARDQPAVRHVVEHRVFLGDAQRVQVQRQQVAEDDDLAALGALRQRRGDQVRRRHQAVDVLVVLVEHHAVEAELVGIGELVDILLIEAAALLRVPQRVRHRHPAGVVFLVEIRRQVRIRHEVPAVELDGFAHRQAFILLFGRFVDHRLFGALDHVRRQRIELRHQRLHLLAAALAEFHAGLVRFRDQRRIGHRGHERLA